MWWKLGDKDGTRRGTPPGAVPEVNSRLKPVLLHPDKNNDQKIASTERETTMGLQAVQQAKVSDLDLRQIRSLEETVLNYSLPFNAEYLEWKLGWNPEFAERAIREYKRYAYLALSGTREVTPSEVVDEVWHLHILHTQDYERFAAACGRKLHHHPGVAAESDRFQGQYIATLNRYEEMFGDPAPEAIWPRPRSDDLRLEFVMNFLEAREL
jgi:hypothetical protein